LYKNNNKAAIGYKAGSKSVLVAGLSLFALSEPAMSSNHSSAQSFSQADPFSIEIGAYYWFQRYSGDFLISEIDIRRVDVQDDLAIHSDENAVFFLEVNPPLSFLPTLRLQKTVIQSEKNTHVNLTFSLNGIPFVLDTDIHADMDFDHTDLALFYPVWRNEDSSLMQELSVGLIVRRFDGRTLVEPLNPLFPGYELVFDDTVPLIYSQFETGNIAQGLSAKAVLQYGNYKQNEMTDLDLSLRYEPLNSVNLLLGYRQAVLDLGDFSGIEADITTAGVYLGFSLDF
jgi:outer membrane protein